MWLGKLIALGMTHWVDWAVKSQHKALRNRKRILMITPIWSNGVVLYRFSGFSAAGGGTNTERRLFGGAFRRIGVLRGIPTKIR